MSIQTVRPLKIESISEGGGQDDWGPTEVNVSEDYIASKGLSFEGNEIQTLDLSSDDNIQAPAIAAVAISKNVIDEQKIYTISLSHQLINFDLNTIDGNLKIDGELIIIG